MNWRIKMRGYSNIVDSAIWLSKCYIYIYIYIYIAHLSFTYFCPLLLTHFVPPITLPAIQSISTIVQASSWYIAARWCLSIMASLTMPERVNHLGAVWRWPPFMYEVINECACVLIAYWELEAEVQSEADSGLCQIYIYSLCVCVCVFY